MSTPFSGDNYATYPAVQASGTETVRTQPDVFLATKTRLPRTRSGTIQRSHLEARLENGLEGKLILISAPAGTGKTTLLVNWLSDNHLPYCWLSLEAEENEPMRFFSYMVATLRTLYPDAAPATLQMLQSSPLVPAEHLMKLLISELVASDGPPFLLVLDDYHLIHSPVIHSLMSFLLEHLPPRLHLAIASRTDPLFSLTRLRARGELTELRMGELRFNQTEIQTLLQVVTGLQLDEPALELIAQRTEGWITGVQLAALSLRHADNPHTFLQSFHGNNRFVLDYLSEEVFFQQAPEVQEFLLSTCLLEKLQESLCNAVTGRDDSQAILSTLERSNLFLVPLDTTREWYRYHPLFAEILRTRLYQGQPEHIAALHLRASRWYEQQGFIIEAVHHAIGAQESERIGLLLEEYGLDFIFTQEIPGLVLQWLEALPISYIEARPQLCILDALACIYQKRYEQARQALTHGEAALASVDDSNRRDLFKARLLACTSLLHFALEEIPQSVISAQEALALLPASERMLRYYVLHCVMRGYQHDGNLLTATERLAVDTVMADRSANQQSILLLSLNNLAWIQVLRGRLHQAAQTYREIMRVLAEESIPPTLPGRSDHLIGYGFLLREWNQLERAQMYVERGVAELQSSPSLNSDLLAAGYITLARLAADRGEFAQAFSHLDTLELMQTHQSTTGTVLQTCAAIRAELYLMQGNLSGALQWANFDAPPVSNPPAYPLERVSLAWIRVRLAQSRVYPYEVSLIEIKQILQNLLEDAENKGRIRSVLEARILLTLTLDLEGQTEQALTTLKLVLRYTEAEHMIRLLADEGQPMRNLLAQIQTTHPLRQDYLQQVIHASTSQIYAYLPEQEITIAREVPQTYPVKRLASLPEPLSERELEVLRLINQGAANSQIARDLVIAVSTVKRHITNIFAKLDASSRTQALARAREHGLL